MTTESRILEIQMKARDLTTKVVGKVGKSLTAMRDRAKRAFKAVGRAAKVAGRAIKTMLAPITKVMALMGLLSGAAFGALLKSAADAIDTVGKFSDRLGLSTEFLSEMAHAAELSGVNVRAMQVGFQRATRRLAEFRQRGAGPAADAIRGLGLEQAVMDGKDLETLLPRMADAFANLEDDAVAVRLAFGLFDSEGVSMIQMLNQGAEGIARMRAEAQKFGLSISQDAAFRAAEFNDALARLIASLEGIKRAIGVAVFRELARVLERLADWVAKNREAISKFFSEVINKMAILGSAFFKAFADEQTRTRLFQFLKAFFVDGFGILAEYAAVAFVNAFKSALGKDATIFGIELVSSEKAAVNEKAIEARLQRIRAAYSALKRDIIGDSVADSMLDETEVTAAAIDSGRRFASGFEKGFRERANEINLVFKDLEEVGAATADAMAGAFETNFFDFAVREFRDFGQFVRDFFKDLVEAILSIVSKKLAGQVVSGLGALLGAVTGADLDVAGAPGAEQPNFGGGGGDLGGGFDIGGGGGVAGGAQFSSAGGAERGSISVNFNVNAVDGPSVEAFFSRNGEQMAAAIASAAGRNGTVRGQLRGSIA